MINVLTTYADEVRTVIDGFDYELCAECHGDLDAHAITPDVLGHAHAICLTAAVTA